VSVVQTVQREASLKIAVRLVEFVGFLSCAKLHTPIQVNKLLEE
jgi:hypothetical protein